MLLIKTGWLTANWEHAEQGKNTEILNTSNVLYDSFSHVLRLLSFDMHSCSSDFMSKSRPANFRANAQQSLDLIEGYTERSPIN